MSLISTAFCHCSALLTHIPALGKDPQYCINMVWGGVGHMYNPSTGEAEAEGSEIEGHLGLHSEFEASKGHLNWKERGQQSRPLLDSEKMPGR